MKMEKKLSTPNRQYLFPEYWKNPFFFETGLIIVLDPLLAIVRPPVFRAVLPGMVVALDTAHVLLTGPAASAATAAVAIVIATAIALARAIDVALVLRGTPLGASDFNFTFNTS